MLGPKPRGGVRRTASTLTLVAVEVLKNDACTLTRAAAARRAAARATTPVPAKAELTEARDCMLRCSGV